MAMVSGEFSVGMAAQAAEDGSAAIGRMVLDKRYHGALEARGAGQMLATHGSVAGSAIVRRFFRIVPESASSRSNCLSSARSAFFRPNLRAMSRVLTLPGWARI